MTESVRDTVFGVSIFVGDRCFVLYTDILPRAGTIKSISDDGATVSVALDSGETIDVGPERLTLSFKLWHDNETRRGAA